MKNTIKATRRSVLAGSAVAVALPIAAKGQGPMVSTTRGPIAPKARELLARIAPDLPERIGRSQVHLTDEFDQRAHALVGLATLAALGGTRAPYETRVRSALAAGVRPVEVVETGLHTLVYAGFPAAQEAMARTQSVFEQDGVAYKAESRRPQGNDRALGLANLRQTGGEAFAENWAKSPSEFESLALRFAHGEIWNRPDLSVRDRELITLAMLLVVGDAEDAITFHVTACRRLGWTRAAIAECLLTVTDDVGLAGLLAAGEAVIAGFQPPVERAPQTVAPRPDDADNSPSDEERLRRGQGALDQISQSSGQSVVSSFDAIAPDLGRYILEFPYGEIFSRPGLDFKSRELATIAALAATGRTVDEIPLSVHVNAALNVGASPREVSEALLHMIPYAGFVRVEQAVLAAEKVFAERGLALESLDSRDQSETLTIIGRLEAKPGRGADLKAALIPVVAASRQEPGCINYDLHEDEADAERFVIYENWRDQAALDRHFEQPHSVALAAKLPDLLERPLTMERLVEVSDWIGRKSL